MKKVILSILATVFLAFNAFSQSDNSSEVYFVVTPTVTKKVENYHHNVKLYLNNKLVASFSTETVLKCKLYSEGRISVSIVYKDYVDEGFIDIKHNNDAYYYIGGYGYKINKEYFGNKMISKETFEQYFEETTMQITNILEVEEDINDPIGKVIATTKARTASQGTGFLINNEGYIVTNFHVIDGAQKINILGINSDYSTSFDAKIIAIDRQSDLALLKIESKLITFNNPPYTIISSQNTKQAESTFTLGYPIKEIMGNEIKITNGIINSLSGYKGSVSEFQISASVQAGNSGSPLFNSKGQIIGVVSAKIQAEGVDNVGYALKSDYLQTFLNQIEGVKVNSSDNSLENVELSEQVKQISDFIYLIITE